MIVPMITVDNLVKRYPKRPVNSVDNISFQVTQGEAFGLLGPNGAGKSTTIGTITTRVRPTGGQVLIGDVDVARDPVAARRRLAVVPQRNNLDRALTARENLLFHGAYFGYSKRERAQRADALLQEFGLGERGEEKTDKYSGGMAQRLMIARALMHDPELLVLDEPTTGVDPQARLFVWDRISELNKRGLTLLLTTHDMVEVERLCTRVAIMDHGKILAIDSLSGHASDGEDCALHWFHHRPIGGSAGFLQRYRQFVRCTGREIGEGAGKATQQLREDHAGIAPCTHQSAMSQATSIGADGKVCVYARFVSCGAQRLAHIGAGISVGHGVDVQGIHLWGMNLQPGSCGLHHPAHLRTIAT